MLALVLLAGAGLMLRTVVCADRTRAPDSIPSGSLALQFSLIGKAYAEDPAVVVFQDRALETTARDSRRRGAALAGQIPFGGNGDCCGLPRERPHEAEPRGRSVHRAVRRHARLLA